MHQSTNTRRLRIHGYVQGVGYRYGMVVEAERLGVTGWVRNRRDGTVEALIQGEERAVARLIDWARQGPGGAQVTKVEVELVEPVAMNGFNLRPTL
jgi:acylphosphatase